MNTVRKEIVRAAVTDDITLEIKFVAADRPFGFGKRQPSLCSKSVGDYAPYVEIPHTQLCMHMVHLKVNLQTNAMETRHPHVEGMGAKAWMQTVHTVLGRRQVQYAFARQLYPGKTMDVYGVFNATAVAQGMAPVALVWVLDPAICEIFKIEGRILPRMAKFKPRLVYG